MTWREFELTRIVCFILFLFSLFAFACEEKKIQYIEFKKTDGDSGYISIPDVSIRLPVDDLVEYYHGSDGFTFIMKHSGGVSVSYLSLEPHLIDALFFNAQAKVEDYCIFKRISERPVVNIFSHYMEANYSVVGRFIVAQGKTHAGETLNQVYFKSGVGKVAIILHYPEGGYDHFIQRFIALNVESTVP